MATSMARLTALVYEAANSLTPVSMSLVSRVVRANVRIAALVRSHRTKLGHAGLIGMGEDDGTIEKMQLPQAVTVLAWKVLTEALEQKAVHNFLHYMQEQRASDRAQVHLTHSDLEGAAVLADLRHASHPRKRLRTGRFDPVLDASGTRYLV